MAISILQAENRGGANALMRIAVDSLADLSELAEKGMSPVIGSTAVCIEDGYTYILGSDDDWHKQQGTGGGTGGGAKSVTSAVLTTHAANGTAVFAETE